MTVPLNATIADVTARIIARSAAGRAAYLERIRTAGDTRSNGPHRARMGCANLAHTFAACAADDKESLKSGSGPSIAIVTAYNDMLSAHQPYETYPERLRQIVRAAGGVAQVAGGVPAMCDGVTQGEPGMELSLFSRDVIAMATGVALSHDTFDGTVCLGICDKIVPGLVIGALAFGHLPTIFIPSGPMPSGLSNPAKSKVRQDYATGNATRADLLEAESQSYHAPGTCTFYGTANTNQMLMEIMGMHLPGASFVNPGTPLRHALTEAAAQRVTAMAKGGADYIPVGEVLDEKAFVNGIIGLLATGGSTNLTIHLIAMAATGGITLTWNDFHDLSAVVPLLARVYPNGTADVNAFQAAGGMAYLIGQLLDGGLLHRDVKTVLGAGLEAYRRVPALHDDTLVWVDGPTQSLDPAVVASLAQPFAVDGGLRILEGNLGRAVIKISAVKPEHWVIEAPARVFGSQEAVQAAFKAGDLHGDAVIVVRFQGPRANGMPELHKLTPPLGVLQDLGFKVALVTDGRMSGASGKIPAAIHVTPEVVAGGPLGKVRDGDVIRLDAAHGTLEVKVDPAEWAARSVAEADLSDNHYGVGRELFSAFRASVGGAENGASVFGGGH